MGFNNGPLYDLDEIVRFEKAQTTSNGINIRPDIWLFPFLNVYAIFAKSKTSTAINAGVWIPDSSTWNKILDIDTKADFNATTYGFGLTPTVGVSGFFITLDMNFTWSDIDALSKPAFAAIFGPRIGKNITWANHPERSWTVWVGGFRLKLNTGTSGSLNTADLFPVDEWGKKLDTGYMKVAESQREWLTARRRLNLHRAELTRIVSQLYPPAVRLDSTGILMPPSWRLPERRSFCSNEATTCLAKRTTGVRRS